MSVLQVLAAESPKKSTRTMYDANLTYKALDEILNLLTEKGLITHGWRLGWSHMYRVDLQITPRGRELLSSWLHLKLSLAPDEKIDYMVLPDSDWMQKAASSK